MKKRLLALLLMLALLVSCMTLLSACGKKDKGGDSSEEPEVNEIVGTWSGDMEVSMGAAMIKGWDALEGRFLSEVPAEFQSDMESIIKEFARSAEDIKDDVSFEMTFEENGKAQLTITRDSTRDSKQLEKLMDKLAEALVELAVKAAAKENNMSVSQFKEIYREQTGTTLEDLFKQEFIKELDSSEKGEKKTNELDRYYEVEDDKLFLKKKKSAEFDEDMYFVYEISGDKLKITEATDEMMEELFGSSYLDMDEDEFAAMKDYLDDLFPITLKRD